MYVQRYTEARSRNRCRREKAVSITYYESESVAIFYPACKAHAPYYILICGLSGCTTIFHIISPTARILGGKMLSNVTCVI